LKIIGLCLRAQKGVFSKKRVTFPISPFMSVVIEQTKFEAFFGLCNCKVFITNTPFKDILYMPCLKKDNAEELKSQLLSQVDRMQSVSKGAKKLNEELLNNEQAIKDITKTLSKINKIQ
jgi:uncharacterized membrane protein YdbT with pleckstrin-like domain